MENIQANDILALNFVEKIYNILMEKDIILIFDKDSTEK